MKKVVGLALKGSLRYYTRLVCVNAKPKNSPQRKGVEENVEGKKVTRIPLNFFPLKVVVNLVPSM
jgi:hypothetical protein